MKRIALFLLLALAVCQWMSAQRFTDALDRGLVAVPTGATGGSTSNFISWRRLAEEYYGVTYNLYKNGSLLASGLTTTSYDDWNRATPTTSYQVAAVVNGVEQTRCAAITPWTQYVYKLGDDRNPSAFIDITLAAVYDRDGNDVTIHYEPNDAEMADLDGDGQLEIIVKRLNTYDAWNGSELYPVGSREFVVLDAYDVNWQTGAATLLWRIDCGPNMISLNSTEIDIIAYDWDEDGQAEVILRGADNMIVYGSDGRTQLWTVGNMSVNTRDKTGHSDQQYSWTHTGAEYLIYMNGRTGARYQVTTYPLPRLENGESSEKKAWGDDYGHRSSKYFFGAPFLDGRKASLFLARGIYTRHKMIAMDLDPSSHTWSERWRWNNNSSSSPWYGQGNHNFVVADVDEDGRDEIVYGSMVIDDNGRGLSTTGLGHGDAIHVGDLDPYRKGLEVFACNEEKPACNYRNATTSQLYFRQTGSEDDGRALMANFTNSYPGSVGRSVQTGMISSVADKVIGELGELIAWGDLNFRIYWDGDLCSEVLNSPGEAREAKIEKPGVRRLFTSNGCNMNNGSKNNPCFQGDIIGDWREEIVVRCGLNLRVYTTGFGTAYTMPSLWFDHQYRQAMAWQMMAYNQPPHPSYFLGEMEGITVAPPPLTNRGRTEATPGSTISTGLNGKHVLICDNTSTSTTYTLANGARPSVITVNTPTWVQGNNDNGNITVKDDYIHTLQGTLSSTTRLTKQGGGTLRLSATTHTHTGPTDVWAGTLQCDGTFQSSPLWLNRFTTLRSTNGNFKQGITALYGATIIPGGENNIGSITTTTLTLDHGARLLFDIDTTLPSLPSPAGEGLGVRPELHADQLNVTTLNIATRTGSPWTTYGPRYLKPVLQIANSGVSGGFPAEVPDATYDLGTVTTINGSIDDIILEGISNATLKHANGHLYLVVGTGIPTICTTPDIAETTLQATPEGILQPVVNITPTPFTYNGNTVMPELSATFTEATLPSPAGEGSGVRPSTEADIIRHFYYEDYESATDVTGWTSPGAAMSIATDDPEHGHYFAVNTGSTNTRYAYYILPASVAPSTASSYAIEFDLAVTSSNTDPVEFCVMSRGGIMPTKNWDNYAAINGNANMLFDITAPKYSTTFTVNGTTTADIPAGTWHHYILHVDCTLRRVTWSISNGCAGIFDLPDATSTDIAGFYLVAGRYYSAFRLDNIHIYSTGDYTYAFQRPGTLTITSSYPGCIPSTTNYDDNYVALQVPSQGITTFACRYPLDISATLPYPSLPAFIVPQHYNTKISIAQVTAVPPATGIIIMADPGTYRIPIATTTPPSITTNLLQPVTDPAGFLPSLGEGSGESPTTAIYTLQHQSTGIGFYTCPTGQIIPPATAYLQLTGTQLPTFISIQQLLTVGIDTPSLTSPSLPTTRGNEDVNAKSVNGKCYDLSGRQILNRKPQSRIYIQNHRKYITTHQP